MELRPAELDDLEALTEMNIRLRQDEEMDNVMTDAEVRERMRGFMLSASYKCFLVQVSAETAGYCVVDVSRKPLYLRQLFVKPEHRGCGLGKACLTELAALFGTDEIDVDVMIRNERAISFYEKNGFKKRYLGMRLKRT